MIPNVLFLQLNAIFGHRFRSQPRLLTAMILIIGEFEILMLIVIYVCKINKYYYFFHFEGLFIFSDTMAKVNTDAWQKQFMSLTLFTVVIINIMVAIFQVHMYILI